MIAAGVVPGAQPLGGGVSPPARGGRDKRGSTGGAGSIV